MKISTRSVAFGVSVLASSFLYISTLQAQQLITLNQAIDSALANNIQVKQAAISTALGEQDLRFAKSSLLPNVNGNVYGYKVYGNLINATDGKTMRTGVTIGQGNLYADVTLFQGFQKLNTIKQNKFFLDADKNNLQKVKNDLVLNVLSTYLRVLTNRDLLTAAKQQLDVAKQQLDKEQKFYNAKQKTLADLSQAKSQLANAELNVTNSQNEMELAYLTLSQLMERSGAAFTVVSPLKDAPVNLNTRYSAEYVYGEALKQFPDIQMLTNQRLGYEKSVDVAKGQLTPKLSLAGNLNTSYSGSTQDASSAQIVGNQTIGYLGDSGTPIIAPTYAYHDVSFGTQLSRNFNQSVGLVLTIPISNGFAGRINVRKAELNYENAKASEQLAKLNLNKIIDEAVWDVQATKKKYQSSLLSFKSADDAFKIIQQRYTVGLVSSQDVSIAETDRNAAEFSVIQARYDLIFKNKLIDYYLGRELKL